MTPKLRQLTLFAPRVAENEHRDPPPAIERAQRLFITSDKQANLPFAGGVHDGAVPKSLDELIQTHRLPVKRERFREIDQQVRAVAGFLHRAENELLWAQVGWGKTPVAALVAANVVKPETSQDVLFLCSSREMVSQVANSMRTFLEAIPVVSVVGGGVAAERKSLYERLRNRITPQGVVVVATYEVIAADIRRGAFEPKRFGLVIFDEGDKCVGDHAGQQVARFFTKLDAASRARFLVTTATAASDTTRLRALLSGLNVTTVRSIGDTATQQRFLRSSASEHGSEVLAQLAELALVGRRCFEAAADKAKALDPHLADAVHAAFNAEYQGRDGERRIAIAEGFCFGARRLTQRVFAQIAVVRSRLYRECLRAKVNRDFEALRDVSRLRRAYQSIRDLVLAVEEVKRQYRLLQSYGRAQFLASTVRHLVRERFPLSMPKVKVVECRDLPDGSRVKRGKAVRKLPAAVAFVVSDPGWRGVFERVATGTPYSRLTTLLSEARTVRGLIGKATPDGGKPQQQNGRGEKRTRRKVSLWLGNLRKEMVVIPSSDHPCEVALCEKLRWHSFGSAEGAIIIFTRYREHAEYLAQRINHLVGKEAGARATYLTGSARSKAALRSREERLAGFRKGDYNIIVATSVAERGLHIPALNHAYLFGVTSQADAFFQQIGRVGRTVGKPGVITAFVVKNSADEIALRRAVRGVQGMLRLFESYRGSDTQEVAPKLRNQDPRND